MDHKLLYAFRGWIAFVAFMDLGTCVRCFIEKRAFLGDYSKKSEFANDALLPRMLGMFSLLKALALIHCTLFIHYKPVVSLGICSIVVSLLMCALEVLVYTSTTPSFYIVFPCVLNALTLLGLALLPRGLLEAPAVAEDENLELLRQATAFRRRRPRKVN
ncbi:uncharacterized protein LOC134537486 isoform X2 [Bacillus rossius redtenbacheri]|uniref:uncharacterized protein LOC134537486 isoform X2 n=1 Tax=Bacillus rossius redtenbacheri TaxID=93214 RepID=UPI002FDEFCBE